MEWNKARLGLVPQAEAFLRDFPGANQRVLVYKYLLSALEANQQHDKVIQYATQYAAEAGAVPDTVADFTEKKMKALKDLGRKDEAWKAFGDLKALKKTSRMAHMIVPRAELYLRKLAAGDDMPSFSGKSLDGALVSNASLKGKVTVVHTWFLKSAEGLATMGTLASLYQQYRSSGLEIVGINGEKGSAANRAYNRMRSTDKSLKYPYTEDEVKAFLNSRNYGWTQIYDAAGPGLGMVFGLSPEDWPAVMVFGRDGKLIASGLSDKDLEKAVRHQFRNVKMKNRSKPKAPNNPFGSGKRKK
jgi:peroxiredoxin